MLTESIIEDAAMEWFGESYEQVLLVERLRGAVRRCNVSAGPEQRSQKDSVKVFCMADSCQYRPFRNLSQ